MKTSKKLAASKPSVVDQATLRLKDVLAQYILDTDLSPYDPMIDAMVEALKHQLKSDDDSDSDTDETVTALMEDNETLSKRIAKLEKELKAAKAAHAPKAPAAPKARSTTKSGGERAANSYSSFMAMLKGMPEAPEVAGFELTADPQFSATAEKSKTRYEEHRESILHDGKSLHGQTVTLQQAYDAITAAHVVDPMFKNAAVRTAILWAMIPADQRKPLVEMGREHGLCR